MLNVALQPLEEPDLDDRGPARYRLLTAATARSASASDLSVTLHNLSATGLLIHANMRLEIGSTVLVAIPNAGERAARVVWTSGGYHGAEFAEPLTESAVRACLAESKVVWPAFTAAPGREARVAEPANEVGVASELQEDEAAGLSPARRVQIMLGVSAVLWTGVLAGVHALFG